VKALDRKLLRDLWRMWSQALTIALVVASGIGGFITSLSAVDSLAQARDRYYADGRFADLFASVKRAPHAVSDALLAIDGITDVQTTLEQIVRVELPGSADPIIGQVIGMSPGHPARLNRVSVRSGRLPMAQGRDGIEVLVSEGFAQAHRLRQGDKLQALLNGKRRTLIVVGQAISPEFIFAGLWGMPDTRGYGIFWMDVDALAAAFDMKGAFTRVAIKLAPEASAPAAMDAVQRVLAPYGAREVHGREHQASHAMLDNEIKEQRVLGTVLPVIFLGVAAFLLNVVVSRLVSTQREQIATLKALGYADMAIGAHYLKLVLLIVAIGLLLGTFVGDRLGTQLMRLYGEFFHFERFDHRIAPWLLAVSFLICLLTAVIGTLGAIARTVRLPPAEAMRPPAPERFHRTLMETLGVRRTGPILRMTLRNMERHAARTLLSITGVAAALAIVIMGHFFRDAIAFIVDAQFVLSLRGDVTVWSADPLDEGLRLGLARLPGVKAVEPLRFVTVNFVNGHRSERGMVRGYAARPELYRVIDVHLKQTLLDGRGLVMTDRLADKLGLHVGDPVQVEVMEGRPRTLVVPLGATVKEMMGLNAYMDRRALNQLLGDGDVATGYVLSVEPGAESLALEASKALPRVAGAWSKGTMLRNMEEISARNVRIMSSVLTTFAVIIAIGVVYNNARIALAERAWELASLRVLGFTRGEVAAMLQGELAIVIGVALPLGMLLGWGLIHLVTRLLQSDQFLFPVVISPPTYAWSCLVIVAAGAVSAWVVRRHVDRLDMVAALKTRD
jgi:putative ABC transport system permease protein